MYYVIVTQNEEIVTKARKNGDKILVIPKDNGAVKNDFIEKKQQAIITQFLNSLGIVPSLKGFHCLKYIINRSLDEPGFEQKGITTFVYPECAKALDTTGSRVERAIRHSIESGFNSELYKENYIELFGTIARMPTNDHFISTVVLYIKENLL